MKLTVRELSEELGITKQAVFNHIKRNPADFEGHVEKQGNQTYIDEVGQEYIRQKSYGRPQSQITDQTIVEERDQLLRENSILKDRIIALQTELYASAQAVVLANENQRLLEESRINVKQLMEAAEEKDSKISELEKDRKFLEKYAFESDGKLEAKDKEITVLEGFIQDAKTIIADKDSEIDWLKQNIREMSFKDWLNRKKTKLSFKSEKVE